MLHKKNTRAVIRGKEHLDNEKNKPLVFLVPQLLVLALQGWLFLMTLASYVSTDELVIVGLGTNSTYPATGLC